MVRVCPNISWCIRMQRQTHAKNNKNMPLLSSFSEKKKQGLLIEGAPRRVTSTRHQQTGPKRSARQGHVPCRFHGLRKLLRSGRGPEGDPGLHWLAWNTMKHLDLWHMKTYGNEMARIFWAKVMSRSVKRSLRQIGSKGVRLYRLFARRCAIGFCKAHRRTGEKEKK